MAVTRVGLGGPMAGFAQGDDITPPPEPTGGGNFMLMGVRALLLVLLPSLLWG